MNLLDKVRKLNEVLQSYEGVDVQHLAEVLGELENANVYCANEKGLLLGMKQMVEDNTKYIAVASDMYLPELYNRFLQNVIKTETTDTNEACKGSVIVPVYKGNKRLGTLVMDMLRKEAKNDDLVLAEFSATILGAVIARANAQRAEEMRMVMVALETLSYSETKAVKCILGELENNEGYLVASKIADQASITRSVIVNALRKLESAGIIDSRSLGMKGTYIKVKVPLIMSELEKISL